jgi:hypothetical protein
MCCAIWMFGCDADDIGEVEVGAGRRSQQQADEAGQSYLLERSTFAFRPLQLCKREIGPVTTAAR